jgi:glycine betaine/proline transport system ATP-binding protein
MGDRIAILKGGAIIQIGRPEEIVMHPATDYVETFVEKVDRSRVIKAGTIAREELPSFSKEDSVQKAINSMREMKLSHIFTLKDEHPEGVISLEDAETEVQKDKPAVANIVKPVSDAVKPDEQLISVLYRAAESDVPLPVVDENGQLTGMLTKGMLLKAIAGGHE